MGKKKATALKADTKQLLDEQSDTTPTTHTPPLEQGEGETKWGER